MNLKKKRNVRSVASHSLRKKLAVAAQAKCFVAKIVADHIDFLRGE
jgi:hypothetical protein